MAPGAAAPVAPMAGAPGSGVSSPALGIAPSIRSALPVQQNASPISNIVNSGSPLLGKGTAMTEHQSKSAMFGAAMNQANDIISKVEKDGTNTATALQTSAKMLRQFTLMDNSYFLNILARLV
jgi:hypothetical protein